MGTSVYHNSSYLIFLLSYFSKLSKSQTIWYVLRFINTVTFTVFFPQRLKGYRLQTNLGQPLIHSFLKTISPFLFLLALFGKIWLLVSLLVGLNFFGKGAF